MGMMRNYRRKLITDFRQKARDWVVGNLRLVDPRLYEFLGGASASHSGHSVTVDSAMQLSTVWSCIRLVSETVATLPLPVYRTDALGRKVPARDHHLYPLLHDQPNADMTAAEFWESMVACMCLWGNAYAHKERTTQGRLIALNPLRPDCMRVRRARNGAVVYHYRDPDVAGRVIEYSDEDIFHLKGFGTDGLTGMSPITYARHSLGNAMAVEESVGSTFRNMVRPSGVLQTDQILTKAQQDAYERNLGERFSGTINAGKTMTLMAGFKFIPIHMPPEDAQMLQIRGFNVEEICRWFRVPPHMVGHTDKVTSWGSGIEQQMQGFLTFSLRPWLTRIEQTIRKSLIAPLEQGVVSAEFNLEGLLRADSQGRALFYGTMVEKGLMTRNEIRAKENLPPLDGGDKLTVQVNMTFLDLLGKIPAPANTQAEAPKEAVP
jgi:HK97 family phage portal protein